MPNENTVRQARCSRLQAGTLAVIAATLLTPILWGLLIFLFMIVWPMHRTKGWPELALPINGILAIPLACVLARLVYIRLRWHKSVDDPHSFGVLTAGDWIMSGVNFLVLLFVLIVVIRMLGLKGSKAGEIALGLLAPLVSTANAYLYLRGRVRKRTAVELNRLITTGLRCRCGYDLTGNVSGICPECGVPVQLRQAVEGQEDR